MKLFDLLFTRNMVFSCPYAKAEAMARVYKALAHGRVVNTTPIKVSEGALSFTVKNVNSNSMFSIFWAVNKLNPEVTVQFRKSETGTEVQTVCRPNQAHRVIYGLIMIYAVFPELFFCFIRLHGQTLVLSCFLILFFNFVFLGLPGFFSLRFFSKDVLYVIQDALQPDESNI